MPWSLLVLVVVFCLKLSHFRLCKYDFWNSIFGIQETIVLFTGTERKKTQQFHERRENQPRNRQRTREAKKTTDEEVV